MFCYYILSGGIRGFTCFSAVDCFFSRGAMVAAPSFSDINENLSALNTLYLWRKIMQANLYDMSDDLISCCHCLLGHVINIS